MKRLLLLLLLLGAAGLLFSADFGLLVNQEIDAENNILAYNSGFVPWFSWDTGRGFSAYLSGIVSLRFRGYSDGPDMDNGLLKPAVLFELSRFSLGYRSVRGTVEGGRMFYADAMNYTASGFFDGIRYNMPIPQGNVSVAAYYTGLQYKETAKILMTGRDIIEYVKPYEGIDDYFASKRFFAAGRWDMLLGSFSTLCMEALIQYDLNGDGDALNSQYGEMVFEVFPMYKFGITLGGIFEAMQDKERDFSSAFGALARFKTEIPGSLNDEINMAFKYTSGHWNDNFAAFVPLSAHAQGSIFSATISGLALFSAAYSARINHVLFAEACFSYFARTYEDPAFEGNMFGGELWASVAWQPFIDLRVTLGAGMFLPSLGNAYPDGTDPMWKINAGITLSL